MHQLFARGGDPALDELLQAWAWLVPAFKSVSLAFAFLNYFNEHIIYIILY